MKLRLTPLVKVKGGVIDIDVDLFAVGRKEPSFAVFPEQELASLSVRHAQIFCENQNLFVVDLGSECGTRINDRPLKDHPERLRDNDNVAFGTLSFKVRAGEESQRNEQDQTQVVSEEDDATEILQSDSTRHIDSSKDSATALRILDESANDGDSLTQVLGLDSGVGSGVDVTRIHGLTDSAGNMSGAGLGAGPRTTSVPVTKNLGWALGLVVLLGLGAGLWYAWVPGQVKVVSNIAVDPYKAALSVVDAGLANSEDTTVPAQLVALGRKSGTGPNFEQLLGETSRYTKMLYLRNNQQILALLKMRSAQAFRSPVLEAAAVTQIDSVLVPAAYFGAMQSAQESWENGQLVAAINLAAKWSGESGSALAPAMLRRFTRIVEDYEILTTLKGNTTFAPQALAFYFNLDPLIDQFFWARLAQDFDGVSQREIVVASEHLENAGALWLSYLAAGGIDWRMRQNPQITSVFSQRARLLRQMANALAAASSGGFGEADVTSPGRVLPTLLEDEVGWQHEMLKALELATNDARYGKKRALLPPSGIARPGAIDSFAKGEPM